LQKPECRDGVKWFLREAPRHNPLVAAGVLYRRAERMQ